MFSSLHTILTKVSKRGWNFEFPNYYVLQFTTLTVNFVFEVRIGGFQDFLSEMSNLRSRKKTSGILNFACLAAVTV